MTDPRELLDAYAAAEAIDDDYKHPTHEDISPEAIAALRTVLVLHPAIPGLAGSGTAFCLTCWVPGDEGMEPQRWPCPTVQTITNALETR